MAETVDRYFDKHARAWGHVLNPLRTLMLSCGLAETTKWGAPVYLHEDENVVGLAAFKSYAGLWFFKGILLSDPDRVLTNAQEGKTHALRQWRFGKSDVVDHERVRSYIEEAIHHAQAGTQIPPPTQPRTTAIPDELAKVLSGDPALAAAFDALSPGKQREYCQYIGEAKRADTRARRMHNCTGLIAKGEGLNDRYRKR